MNVHLESGSMQIGKSTGSKLLDRLTDLTVYPGYHPNTCEPKGFNIIRVAIASQHGRYAFVDYEQGGFFTCYATQRDVGIELSPRFLSLRQSHLIDFYRLCMERGVKLFIGSDAHALDALGSVDLLQSVVEDLGVQEEDLWHPKEWVW